MINKSVLLPIILIITSQCLQAMERKTLASQRQETSPDQSLHLENTSPGTERKLSIVVVPNQSIDNNITVFSVEPPQGCSNDLTIGVNMQELAQLNPTEIDSFIDDLIREASQAAFGSDGKNAFYAEDLKEALWKAFNEYLSSNKNENQVIEPKKDELIILRRNLVKNVSLSRLKPPSKAPQDLVATIENFGEKIQEQDLKHWMLRELELNNLKLREQAHEHEEKLRELVNANKEKPDDAKLQTKWTLGTTIATTIGSTISALLTFLITYYSTHSQNNAGSS